MLFRFDFKQTDEGKFLVDAHASDGGKHARDRRNSAAVLYASPEVFLDLVHTAGLEPDAMSTLEQAVRTSTSQPETTVCCMEVDLSETHLNHLNLNPALDLYRG